LLYPYDLHGTRLHTKETYQGLRDGHVMDNCPSNFLRRSSLDSSLGSSRSTPSLKAMSHSLSPNRSFLPARKAFQSTTAAANSNRRRALSDQDLFAQDDFLEDNTSGSSRHYQGTMALDDSSRPSDHSDHPPPGQHQPRQQKNYYYDDANDDEDSYDDNDVVDDNTYQQEKQDHNSRFRRGPDPSPHHALMPRATNSMLQSLSERDLFASSPEFACLMPNDSSSSGHYSNNQLLDDDDEDDDDGTPNSSTSGSSMAGDSFGADDLDDDEIQSQRTARRENHSESYRGGASKLGAFFQEQEQSRSTIERSRTSNTLGDEEGSVSRFSVSIMSINSTPFAIREGDENGGDCDDNGYNDAPLSPGMRRSLRSSVASTAILSTTEAFYGLLNEHDKLTMQHEDAVVVMERRKVEKNRLTKVLHSKEEEYIERVDRVESLQSRREKLEFDILEQSAASQLRLAPSSETHHKLRRRQNEAWAQLEKAVSLFEEYRTEGKHMIVDQLSVRPETTHEEVKEELDRNRRRKQCDYLKQRLGALQEEVNKLRGKKKALEYLFPELIGQEIVVEDNDNSGEDEGTIITALTFHSSDDTT
jgi:hypothetical protein